MARIKGGRSSPKAGRETEAPAFVQELVEWRRVTKVSKGGKRMRFSAGVVVGDRKGSIGYVLRKGREVSNAVSSAAERAMRSMVRISLREGRTLHHDTTCFLGGGRVHLRSAPPGTGIIAGGAMRHVFNVLGIQDIVSKSLGSSNKNNTVRATLKALKESESVRSVAARRGLKVSQILPHKHTGEGVKENVSS